MKYRALRVMLIVFAIVFALGSCAAEDDGAEAPPPEAPAETERVADAPADTADESGPGSSNAAAATDSPEFESASAIDMTLSWRVVGDELEVEVAGPTTGWIAVGFKPTRAMRDANIFIGYVSGSDVVMTDQFGISMVDHREDTELGGSSHVTNVSGSEGDGSTTIRFTIPLDSGDEYDQPLSAGETVPVILAYGPDNADDLRTYHADRAGIEITL